MVPTVVVLLLPEFWPPVATVLLVVGLVIWLATLGIFKNPVVVAIALGIGSGAVLAGGWATIRYTRYQTAGRAIKLPAILRILHDPTGSRGSSTARDRLG